MSVRKVIDGIEFDIVSKKEREGKYGYLIFDLKSRTKLHSFENSEMLAWSTCKMLAKKKRSMVTMLHRTKNGWFQWNPRSEKWVRMKYDADDFPWNLKSPTMP